ncbi:MAG: glycoside hydrolase family 3 N-terminal domain-containing protein, partial [Culicoidibacterales bacterium]
MRKISRTKIGIMTIIGIILVGTLFFIPQTHQVEEQRVVENEYQPELGYQPSQLVAAFPVPVNTEVRQEESTPTRINYQITGINQQVDGTIRYLQALDEQGWDLIEKTATDTYVLSNQIETVSITLTDERLTIEIIEDPIQELLETMSLDSKIGQLILAGFAGTTMTSELEILIDEFHVGGLIFFGHNIENAEQVQALTTAIHEQAAIPPFLSVDEEGGRVSRLPDEMPNFPTA